MCLSDSIKMLTLRKDSLRCSLKVLYFHVISCAMAVKPVFFIPAANTMMFKKKLSAARHKEAEPTGRP
jgi:hypothetical protein